MNKSGQGGIADTLTAPNANVPAQISQLALIPLMERRAPARRASEDLLQIPQARMDCDVIKAGLWCYKGSVTPLPSLCNDTWLTSRGHLADAWHIPGRYPATSPL